MTYKELQNQLRKFKALGYGIGCKLNAKKAELQAEYDAIIAAQNQVTEEAMEVETEMANQEAGNKVVLTVKGSHEDMMKIKQAYGDGELTNLDGFTIESIEDIPDYEDVESNVFDMVDMTNDEQVNLASKIQFMYARFQLARPSTQQQFKLRKQVAKLQAKFMKMFGFFLPECNCRNYA